MNPAPQEAAKELLAIQATFDQGVAKLIADLESRDKEKQERAKVTLVAIGQDAMPGLLKALKRDKKHDVLIRIIRTVEAMGPDAVLSMLEMLALLMGTINQQHKKVVEEIKRVADGHMSYAFAMRYRRARQYVRPVMPPEAMRIKPEHRPATGEAFAEMPR